MRQTNLTFKLLTVKIWREIISVLPIVLCSAVLPDVTEMYQIYRQVIDFNYVHYYLLKIKINAP